MDSNTPLSRRPLLASLASPCALTGLLVMGCGAAPVANHTKPEGAMK
ncbi:MAG: hypothetical protein QM533_02120 [Cytophagales bacterium]|nr:hypothetical protein [Cytophagales bacterium]